MAATVDHLSADYRVRVLRAFRDARGHHHDVGECGVIRRIELDWIRDEISIEWERDTVTETLVFKSAAKDGPRNGSMREYFEKQERVPRYEDTLEGRAVQKRLALQQAVPALADEPITGAEHYDAAVQQVWALAARKRFREAEHQLQLILTAPDEDRGRLERVAESMEGLAAAYTCEADEVYDWLRGRAIDLWYSWGSQATSGGEGAAMSVRIREAERRLPERGGTKASF